MLIYNLGNHIKSLYLLQNRLIWTGLIVWKGTTPRIRVREREPYESKTAVTVKDHWDKYYALLTKDNLDNNRIISRRIAMYTDYVVF